MRTDRLPLCISAQTATRPPVSIVHIYMLPIFGVVIVLIAVVIIPRMRVPGGVNSANLGWISERWLAEHRAASSL